MVRMGVVAAVVAVLLAVGTQAAQAQEDLTPPQLLDVQFEPEVVDTAKGPATVTVTVRVTDDLSGVEWAAIDFRKPDTTQFAHVDLAPAHGWGELVAGDARDGYYRGQVTLPQYAAFGTWELALVVLVDNVGNRVDLRRPAGELKLGDSWPSLFNGFTFVVGAATGSPTRPAVFLPLLRRLTR